MVMQIKLVVVVVVSEGRGRVCTQASVSGARSTYSCGMYQISETRCGFVALAALSYPACVAGV